MVVALESGSLSVEFAPLTARLATVLPTRFHQEPVFYVTLGYNFNYSAYRDEVLYSVREKYYQVPSFLPLAPCYFREKYFSDK
jgi:hypothetical protein